MLTTIMISNQIPTGEIGHSNSAIYMWLSSIFWPGAYPPDKNDKILIPFSTKYKSGYYGEIVGKDQAGRQIDLYWHTDNYQRPTWIAFTEVDDSQRKRIWEQATNLEDVELSVREAAKTSFINSENILFWDNLDFKKKMWSSNDNSDTEALKRYKEAVIHIQEYHEAINRPNIRGLWGLL
jgi:hypothetical protein